MLCICLLPITVAAQAKYFNKKYGISLQFPNAYKLKEAGKRNSRRLAPRIGGAPLSDSWRNITVAPIILPSG
jgi:hypothetical protein